jgi:hypothetical protein
VLFLCTPLAAGTGGFLLAAAAVLVLGLLAAAAGPLPLPPPLLLLLLLLLCLFALGVAAAFPLAAGEGRCCCAGTCCLIAPAWELLPVLRVTPQCPAATAVKLTAAGGAFGLFAAGLLGLLLLLLLLLAPRLMALGPVVWPRPCTCAAAAAALGAAWGPLAAGWGLPSVPPRAALVGLLEAPASVGHSSLHAAPLSPFLALPRCQEGQGTAGLPWTGLQPLLLLSLLLLVE